MDPNFFKHPIRKFSYPQPKQKCLEYLASLGTQLVIITMDCKTYITGGLLQLVGLITSTPIQDRCFFEVIPPETPVKLYFDIDHVGRVDLDAYEQFQELFIETVRRKLREDCFYEDWETHCEPLVLKSNGTTKHSIHYIFPVVFDSTALMKHFVHSVVEELKETEFAKDIDLGVYTSWRNFRMVTNTKRGKANHLVLKNADRSTDLRIQLLQCFVSVMRTKVSLGEINPILDSLFVCKRVIKQTETTTTVSLKRTAAVLGTATIPEQYHEIVAIVEAEEISKKFPTASYYRTFQKFNGSDFIDYVFSPGLPCPNNGGKAHKSNKTYFKIDIRQGCVFYRCADPECTKQVFGVKTLRSLGSTKKATPCTEKLATAYLRRTTGKKRKCLTDG